MNISYLNIASPVENYQVPLAAESWNDVPAFIHLSSTSDQGSAMIIVNSTYDQNFKLTGGTPYGGLTLFSCHNGYIDTPVRIVLNDYVLSSYSQDVIILTIAHEMGHAMGIEHSLVTASLMWDGPENFKNYGVYFPVVDDIKAAAALYGWTGDSALANFSGQNGGVGCVTPCLPPFTLFVTTAGSGNYAKVMNNTGLPASKIAIMMAYATPSTLYRFNIGWQDSFGAFGSFEMDNDGFKFVNTKTTGVQIVSSSSPTAGTSYFLELVVEATNNGIVWAHAYAYQGSTQTASGGETFIGQWGGSLLQVVCGLGTCSSSQSNWSDANSFESAVWTDSSSNPASNYALVHFWNFRGGSKPPTPPPAIDSVTFQYLVNVGVQTTVSYNVHSPKDYLYSVSISWGDGSSDVTTLLSSTQYDVSSSSNSFSHIYSVAGSFAPALTVTDVVGQQTSRSWTVNVADFSVSASSPPSVSVGQVATSTIAITGVNGFGGTVSLTDTVPAGLTCGVIGPSSVTLPPSPRTASVSCTSSIAGTYIVTISGTSGSLTHSASTTFTFTDFTITPTGPAAVTVSAGAFGTQAITIMGLNGFTGNVSLANAGPSGLICALTSSIVTLTSTTMSSSVTLVCGASIAGDYTVTVTGIGGSLSHTTAPITFHVVDFTVAAGAVTPTQILAGATGTSTITATAVNGFTGTVTLTASASTPAGLTCSPLTAVTLPPSPGASVLSCSATVAGDYTVTVTGASGTLSHTTGTILFHIVYRDLALRSFGASGTSVQGQVALSASILNNGSIAESSYTVYFYANGSLIGSAPSSYALNPGQSSTLSITWNAGGAAQGTYILRAHVEPTQYDINPSNNDLTIQATVFTKTMTFSGISAIVSWVFTGNNPATKTLSGTTTLTETNSTSGASIMSSTLPMTLMSGDNVTASFVAQTPNAPFWLAASCNIKTNAASNCIFTRTPDVAYAGGGVINIIDTGIAGAAYGSTPSSPKWNPRADVDANGDVSIVDIGIVGAYYGSQVFQIMPAFTSVSANPAYIKIPVSSSNSTTITLASLNSWSGTLSLASSVSPSGGATCSMPATGSVASGGTSTATLSCSASGATPGVYSALVTGANGYFGMSTVVHINVTDFSISSSSLSVSRGSSASSPLALTSLYGFSGNVTLTTSISPIANHGPFVYINDNGFLYGGVPLTVMLNAGATTTNLSLYITAASNTPTGTYSVTITGASGSITHTVTITVTVT